MKSNDVLGIGNMLMDFLIEIDETTFLEMNLRKGESHFLSEAEAQKMLQRIQQYQPKIMPGGSVANTLRGIGLLGGKVILCGKVGNDSHGKMYVEQIKNHHVFPRISTHAKTTGHAITFITPDAQRTFSVHLGAAIELCKEDILEEDIKKSKILQLEAYQLEGPTKEMVLHAIQLAQKHHTLVSLDLADTGVIRRNRKLLQDLLPSLNIIFSNETEIKEFMEMPEGHAFHELAQKVPLVIMKLGSRGSQIAFEGKIYHIQAFPAIAIDTTGAGDIYAAGFLYGYTQQWPLAKAGQLGSMLAAKVIAQKGVSMNDWVVEDIKKKI